MDWCLVEVDRDRGKTAHRRETSVIVNVSGHEAIRSIRLHYAWFESRVLLAGIRAEDLSADQTYDFPVRIRAVAAGVAVPLAFRIFAKKTMRHPRRVLEHAAGLMRVLGAGKAPAAYLAGEWQLRGDDYQAWIESHEKGAGDTPPPAASSGAGRRFSIVIALDEPEPRSLEECLRSVIAQTCPPFEVCVSSGDFKDPEVARLLGLLAEHGHRMVEGAPTGEYLVFLGSEDRLSTAALAAFDRAIDDSEAEAILLYGDEDEIDAAGRRHSPQFKPGWSPDLLRSRNYIGHAFCVKRAAFEQAGGFREEFECAREYDLLFRVSENAGPGSIIRIPEVLYHARSERGARALEEVGREAGKRAIEAHVKRLGGEASVTIEGNAYRTRWLLVKEEPLCSIIILTRDKADLLSLCVRSVLDKTRYGNVEIVIVDNGSTETATADLFREYAGEPRIKILRNDCDFSFAHLNNFATEHAAGEHYCFLNNDVEVISPEWLTEMISHSAREGIGCVGAKLYYPDGRIQHAGVVTGVAGTAGHVHRFFPGEAEGYLGRLRTVQNLSVVTAACLVVKSAVFREAGGFREELAVNYNDVDFCLKVREAGYFNVWTPYAELYHHESVSRGVEDTRRKKARAEREEQLMKELWGVTLGCDPFYSPNLTREREDASIAV